MTNSQASLLYHVVPAAVLAMVCIATHGVVNDAAAVVLVGTMLTAPFAAWRARKKNRAGQAFLR